MYRLVLAAILSQALGGCTSIYVAAGVHHESSARPEITLENPVCVLGGSARLGHRWTAKLEHDSACFVTEEGFGYNRAVIQYELWWD